jgi:outer membrane protein OmpA-like peptidoglycan-associated protein
MFRSIFLTTAFLMSTSPSMACDCASKTTLKEVTSNNTTMITARDGVPLKAEFFGSEMAPAETTSTTAVSSDIPSISDSTATEKAEIYTFEFATNSKTPNRDDMAQLNKIARQISNREAKTVRIVGFADQTGSVNYNQKLSLERAKTVRLLLEKMTGPTKIATVGGGIKATNDLESARVVEVQIVR